jgi:hypothetical protein
MTGTGSLRSYGLVTAAYWGFTLTDGALRMLVLLYFHGLGYSPLQIASLFLLYEFFGIVTNAVGGWAGSRLGLNTPLYSGLAIQIAALGMLAALDPTWAKPLAVGYVMVAQAVSGIAKDLTKMSSKSAVKIVVPNGDESTLFKWVAILTGSKNTLKGAGFFLGGLLLATIGFRGGLLAMAVALAFILLAVALLLPGQLGKAKSKVPISGLFSMSRGINVLSAARLFLFGARDVWFVIALPIFLADTFAWGPEKIGAYLAFWVIGYGLIQALAPQLLRKKTPGANTARALAFALITIPAGIAAGLASGLDPLPILLGGLIVLGIVFAINSAVHSYLIVSYSDGDRVALNVGFYYMANAGGRLVGTILSGLIFQQAGLIGCLWASAILLALAALTSLALPHRAK